MLRNNISLIGRLTKDIEIKKTQTGKSVATFSLAVTDRKNQQGEQASYFFNIVAWNQHADYLRQYASKGDLIGINGRLTNRSYDNQRGEKVHVTEVVAEDVQILSKKQSNAQKASNEPQRQDNLYYNDYQEQKSYSQSPLADYEKNVNFGDEDLPF